MVRLAVNQLAQVSIEQWHCTHLINERPFTTPRIIIEVQFAGLPDVARFLNQGPTCAACIYTKTP